MKIHKILLLTLLSMCLSIYACQENEPNQPETPQEEEEKINTENLIGEWQVTDAQKNGEKLNAIEDAVFIFNNDKTLTINSNFPGINKDEATPYELNDLTVSNVGDFNLNFEITTLTEQVLVLESKIQGMDFKFVLKK